MKTLKTLLATAALTALPGLALAEGCNYGHTETTAQITCAPGATYDADQGTCVTLPTG